MRIVVTGAGGRLGTAMVHGLRLAGHRVTPFIRTQLDVTRRETVLARLSPIRPRAIVNCSAYNAVDAAETDRRTAFAVNAEGPAALADAAADLDAILVHYSTDFVFDGRASEPYVEDAPTRPVNVYGASKLAGEFEVRRLRQHYIVRVESLFGGVAAKGQRATVDYLADSLIAGGPVRAVVDRTVSPSYVDDIVRTARALLEWEAPFGTYHCVSSGSTTWYELASEIARRLGVTAAIEAVKADDFRSAAVRPRFCALSNDKLKTLGVRLPAWTDALARHLAKHYAGARSETRVRIA